MPCSTHDFPAIGAQRNAAMSPMAYTDLGATPAPDGRWRQPDAAWEFLGGGAGRRNGRGGCPTPTPTTTMSASSTSPPSIPRRLAVLLDDLDSLGGAVEHGTLGLVEGLVAAISGVHRRAMT